MEMMTLTSLDVFSTYVEVILLTSGVIRHVLSFLHVCGGDPHAKDGVKSTRSVFSTYVEVILYIERTGGLSVSFLHVCGGDPYISGVMSDRSTFSPRMWR